MKTIALKTVNEQFGFGGTMRSFSLGCDECPIGQQCVDVVEPKKGSQYRVRTCEFLGKKVQNGDCEDRFSGDCAKLND